MERAKHETYSQTNILTAAQDKAVKLLAQKQGTTEAKIFRKATLPPGTNWLNYLKEHYHDPDSPFQKIVNDMREQFGPVLPERVESSLEEIRSYVHAMPGTVYEIYYVRAGGKPWVYHIMDIKFMRARLYHPRCLMIK